MVKSEIFNEYAKIAIDTKLIKVAKSTRYDSLSNSDIKNLYDVKPKTQTYEYNIMEDAHPNACIVGPAYDKINALIENENERQQIALHIINKTPTGNLTNKKYAEDLLLELIKLGNEMEVKDQDDLRSLADTCATQLSKPIEKKAVFPWLAAGGVAAVLALLGTLNYTLPSDQGVRNDVRKFLDEIKDIKSFGPYTDKFLGPKGLIETLNKFLQIADKYYELTPEFSSVKQIDPSKPVTPNGSNKAIVIEQYYKACKFLSAKIISYAAVLERLATKSEDSENQYESPGMMDSITHNDWFHKAKDYLHTSGLIRDDFTEAARMLRVTSLSMANAVKEIDTAKREEHESILDAFDSNMSSEKPNV